MFNFHLGGDAVNFPALKIIFPEKIAKLFYIRFLPVVVLNTTGKINLPDPFMMMKFLVLSVSLFLFSNFQANPPIKVIFFGDSITQAGVQPDGFVSLMQKRLKDNNQDKNYELIGAGIGGNKVYDLYLRFEDDVLQKKPAVVVIWVGVNDVWHKRTSLTGTDPDKFLGFYTALIKKLQAQNVKVIVCTPATIGEKTDFSNEMDGDLNKYAQFIRDLGAKYNCEVVDFRTAFHEYGLKNNSENKEKGILTSDGVHLNPKGNQFVAEMLYKAIVK
ncbi:MAG: SGNH/GDSL hydrolase family protein [Sphingobacteriaceae bacterium]